MDLSTLALLIIPGLALLFGILQWKESRWHRSRIQTREKIQQAKRQRTLKVLYEAFYPSLVSTDDKGHHAVSDDRMLSDIDNSSIQLFARLGDEILKNPVVYDVLAFNDGTNTIAESDVLEPPKLILPEDVIVKSVQLIKVHGVDPVLTIEGPNVISFSFKEIHHGDGFIAQIIGVAQNILGGRLSVNCSFRSEIKPKILVEDAHKIRAMLDLAEYQTGKYSVMSFFFIVVFLIIMISKAMPYLYRLLLEFYVLRLSLALPQGEFLSVLSIVTMFLLVIVLLGLVWVSFKHKIAPAMKSSVETRIERIRPRILVPSWVKLHQDD